MKTYDLNLNDFIGIYLAMIATMPSSVTHKTVELLENFEKNLDGDLAKQLAFQTTHSVLKTKIQKHAPDLEKDLLEMLAYQRDPKPEQPPESFTFESAGNSFKDLLDSLGGSNG